MSNPRTVLDEIAEMLERAYDPNVSDWQKYEAVANARAKLWDRAEQLLAVVRAAAACTPHEMCFTSYDDRNEVDECAFCGHGKFGEHIPECEYRVLREALRTLDPKLLGEDT